MSSKILFIVDSGIGNQIQTLPAMLYCKKKYQRDIDVYTLNRYWLSATKVLFKNFATNVFHKKKQINIANYYGKIYTYPTRSDSKTFRGIKDISIRHGKKCSEVEYSMELVGNDYSEEDFNIREMFSNGFTKSNKSIDVLFQDGYSKVSQDSKLVWEAKSYPYYGILAELFTKNGLSVGSMGSKDEYVKGTKNLTNLGLDETIGLVKSCKLLICNDTGMYHLANILGVKNLVIFTFTSLKKNYDQRFHKFSKIIRRKDLSCSPCQGNKRFWLRNKKKCKWACRAIKPDSIYKQALKYIGESK